MGVFFEKGKRLGIGVPIETPIICALSVFPNIVRTNFGKPIGLVAAGSAAIGFRH
jgi:hypothetical protein